MVDEIRMGITQLNGFNAIQLSFTTSYTYIKFVTPTIFKITAIILETIYPGDLKNQCVSDHTIL